MMQLVKYLTASSLLLLTSCQTPKITPPVVEEVKSVNIPLKAKPNPVRMNDIYIYVVNENEVNAFISEYKNKSGTDVFYAFSPRDYENLSLNLSQLRFYIRQQNAIINYYENTITSLQPK